MGSCAGCLKGQKQISKYKQPTQGKKPLPVVPAPTIPFSPQGQLGQKQNTTSDYFKFPNLYKEVQQYAMILGVQQQLQYDIQKIKAAFRQKTLVTRDRKQRVVLNNAYHKAMQKIYKISTPPLLSAIASGETEKVRNMLNSNKNLLNQKIFDYVPLHYAVRSGHQDIVQMILKMGCSLNFNGHKSTPMHCAAYYGHPEIIHLLLRYGLSKQLKNEGGFLPIDESATGQIRRILLLNPIDYGKILQLPVEDKQNYIKIKNAYRKKMIRATENFQERVKLNQAYVAAFETVHKRKSHSLLWAIASGKKKEISNMFKQNKQLLNTLIYDYPPLYYAVRSGHYDIVEMILKMGCSLEFQGQKSTPMHCAAFYGNCKIIQLLIKYGISTTIKNNYNQIPKDQSATEEIRMLLQQNQKLFKGKVDYGKILQIAPQNMANFLIIKNAFRQKIIKASQNFVQRVQLNLAYLSAAETIYKTESPSILYAIARGQESEVTEILKKDQKLINNLIFGYVPLYYAARSGHYQIVEIILKMGCSRKFEGQDSTPMHGAAYFGHYKIITLLLQYGIPTDIKNKNGQLPIDDSATDEIRQLLKNNEKNKINQIIRNLNDKTLQNLPIQLKKGTEVVATKIILTKNYFLKFNNHQDVFHGTGYASLVSIAQFGMKKPGERAGTKATEIVPGHIKLGLQFRGIKDWSNAIFVSPSIYYAAHSVYSKQFISQNIGWMPIIQLKVEKGSFQKFQHTLYNYSFQQQEPNEVEYRIENNSEKKKKIFSQDNPKFPVTVVAIIFLKKGFLQSNPNYNQVTKFLVNSEEQKKLKITRK